jgi:hypothetical protein
MGVLLPFSVCALVAIAVAVLREVIRQDREESDDLVAMTLCERQRARNRARLARREVRHLLHQARRRMGR